MPKPEKAFSRKRSAQAIGQLYPILLSKDGQIIDGFHRKEEDPTWRTETLEHIDTEEKLLLARAAANWHRRIITWKEKRGWINGLAQLYIDQGLKVRGLSDRGSGPNEVVKRIIDELGLSRGTVMKYLDPKYKQNEKGGLKTGPRVPASQAIKGLSGGRGSSYSGDLAERHEKEIRAKLLHDPDFRQKILLQIEKEVLIKEDDEDPEVEALTTMNFHNLVHQHQEGLRQIVDNPIRNPFQGSERASLRRWGVVKQAYKVIRVYTLTPEALAHLGEVSG